MSATLTGAILDTETTGRFEDDELIELAIVLFSFDRQTGQLIEVLGDYHGLRYPDVSIRKGATAVHGLRKQDLRGQAIDGPRAQGLLSRADVILAHNAKFDRRYVTKLFPLAAQKPWYCTMNGIPWRRLGFRSKGLQNLLEAHNLEPGQAHRALDDTRALLELITRENNKTGETYLHILISGKAVAKGRSTLGRKSVSKRLYWVIGASLAAISFACCVCALLSGGTAGG